MNVMEFLDERAVTVDVTARQSKEEVIRELVGLLVRAGSIKERDVHKLVQILLKRESLGSTGIGQGVAIPHGKSDCVTKLIGAFGVSRAGVDFDALDGEPVTLFFLLVAPEDSAGPSPEGARPHIPPPQGQALPGQPAGRQGREDAGADHP